MILLVALVVLALVPQAAWLIATYRHARENHRMTLWTAGVAGFTLTTLAITLSLLAFDAASSVPIGSG